MVNTRSHTVIKEEAKEIVLDSQVSKMRFKKEVKKEENEKPPVLSQSSIERRLANVESKPFNIRLDPEIVHTWVSRTKFLSPRYGGCQRDTFSRPSAEMRRKHGIGFFAFPMPKMNPYLPKEPGHPGLSFTHRKSPDPIPLFRWMGSNKSKYMGDYMWTESEPLTVEEWMSQTSTVRASWLAKYMKKFWGREARVRIILRRELVREPSEEEFDEGMRLDRWTEVDKDVVEDALNDGTEKIPVSAIECVTYREEFQRELVDGFKQPSSTWEIFPYELYWKRGLAKGELREDDRAWFFTPPKNRASAKHSKAQARKKSAAKRTRVQGQMKGASANRQRHRVCVESVAKRSRSTKQMKNRKGTNDKPGDAPLEWRPSPEL